MSTDEKGSFEPASAASEARRPWRTPTLILSTLDQTEAKITFNAESINPGNSTSVHQS